MAVSGKAWRGLGVFLLNKEDGTGKAWRGRAWTGVAWQGLGVFLAQRGEARTGQAGIGKARRGLDGRGLDGRGLGVFFPHKEAWLGWAGCGVERSGEARFLFLLEVM